MGISLYGAPSNLRYIGKVSWSDDVMKTIEKYHNNYDDIFEIFIDDLKDMINELAHIEGTEDLISNLNGMITSNNDYYTLGFY